LAGVVSGFADVLAYFRFDDLLASLRGDKCSCRKIRGAISG
jgi:hypothetical protein